MMANKSDIAVVAVPFSVHIKQHIIFFFFQVLGFYLIDNNKSVILSPHSTQHNR